MQVDMKDLPQVNKRLYELKYVLNEPRAYERLGSNMMLFYTQIEDELIKTHMEGFKTVFDYPFIVEYIAAHSGNSNLFTKVIHSSPFFEELYFFKALPGDERSRSLIELFMMHDDIMMDQVTLYKIINIALKMPGTKYFNYIVSDVISKVGWGYDVFKRTNDGAELLPTCQVGKTFASEMLSCYNYGNNLERKDYKDLRFLILRHQYGKLLRLTYPYDDAFKKLVYDFYDEQDVYDLFIDDYFLDISQRLEDVGINVEFVDEVTSCYKKVRSLLELTDNKELTDDFEFLVRLLRVRPYCFGGSNSDGN